LKPIAETIPPKSTHSRRAHKVAGVKNTRCIYTNAKADIKMMAFKKRLVLPVVDLPTFSK